MPVNMSHCRHHNTLMALSEVEEDLDLTTELSDAERAARDRLLSMCKRIADDYEDEIEQINLQRRRAKAQAKPTTTV